MFVEPSIQAWAQQSHLLINAADWAYLNSHLVVTVGALTFIYMRRNDSFYFVRNMFMIAMLIALVGYAVYPTAPPRLMAEWGFTDSIQQFTGIKIEQGPGSALLNAYAAVPSMHVCFALMIGVAMAGWSHRPALKLLWCLYPLCHRVRRDRHRQPLPHRRVPRCPHRRRRGAALAPAAGPRAA